MNGDQRNDVAAVSLIYPQGTGQRFTIQIQSFVQQGDGTFTERIEQIPLRTELRLDESFADEIGVAVDLVDYTDDGFTDVLLVDFDEGIFDLVDIKDLLLHRGRSDGSFGDAEVLTNVSFFNNRASQPSIEYVQLPGNSDRVVEITVRSTRDQETVSTVSFVLDPDERFAGNLSTVAISHHPETKDTVRHRRHRRGRYA